MSHVIHIGDFWGEKINALKQRGFSPLTAIDIGATVGVWYTKFKEIFPHANVLGIEANPRYEDELKSVNPNSKIMLLGRENNDAGVEFYINPGISNDEGASIYKEATQWGNKATAVNLPMATLDSLNQRFDWIKIDVQGAELDVLEGGDETLQYAMIVELELSTMRYNQGAPLAGEVIRWMWESGFELLDIIGLRNIEENGDGVGKLVQFDALFLNRKYGHLLNVIG